MGKKPGVSIVMLVLVLVFGLAGSAFAGTWTNGGSDNSWCNSSNCVL